jgi:hypothetical protein
VIYLVSEWSDGSGQECGVVESARSAQVWTSGGHKALNVIRGGDIGNKALNVTRALNVTSSWTSGGQSVNQ